MRNARSIASRYYDAFNARDLDTYRDLLDESVEVCVDTRVMVGREATLAYATAVMRSFPGVVAELERVVAATPETVVAELRLVNPAARALGPTDESAGGTWFLAGRACEIIQVRDGRIVALRSYYAPDPADRTPVGQVASRAQGAIPAPQRAAPPWADLLTTDLADGQARADLRLVADEQAALRRVAELVARGAAQTAVLDAIVAQAFELFDVDFTALLRYEWDGSASIIALHNGPPGLAVGDRAPHVPDGLVLRVFRSGRPAHVDAYANVPGPGVARMHVLGVTAGAGAPILVEGRLWGVIAAMVRSGTVASGLEHRLADFAELVATALANTQARKKVQQLADQQAALRQVVELAARDAPADEVLEALASQASELAGVEFTTVLRYEPDGSTEIVALSGAPEGLAVGMRAPGSGDGAVQRVWRTGRAARIERLAAMSGHWPQVAHGFGFATSAAVPILIQGGLWGALVVVGRQEPLSAAIEEHLTSFADLAGTAISGAQARRELRALADEQAALRRVAELVARGAALEEVFTAVAVEASKLLGDLAAALLRYDPDGSATNVAACNSPAPLGLRVPSGEGTATGDVLLNGRPVRVDSFAATPLAGLAEELGVGAGVAVPVTVEGRVWGALTTSTAGTPLPAGTEERLAQFAELAAAAIANAETKAQLTASRARVVATADETRRRLQRDVHDGAQQRLVQTIITLKLARDTAAKGSSAAGLIGEALYHAERANTELRDIVHGILPASLSQGGLRTGLESLIDDIAIPVHLRLAAPRLPAETETTAYFVVAEALTNVVKHARATHAHVTIEVDGGILSVEVRDDGTGGADPAYGSGLIGLSDRVEAAEGILTITSAAGSGTTLHASLPVAGPAASE